MDNKGYLDMELLRFTTAGSVDDGKSTLIGRLLYDSKSIFEDQLEAVRQAAISLGNEELNLALLTDGLRSEREQGITIDVAYRYFATPKRKFIIADTPGHTQYTRNMVTGASTADLAVILVDVRNGITEQTVRHTCIAELLKIPYIAICINKMDMVGYAQEHYERICADFNRMKEKMRIGAETHFIPISAKMGDNVVEKSDKMEWYGGLSLLQLLETVPIDHKTYTDGAVMRFPVQYVIRPISDRFHDYRAYAGRLASGRIHVGERVVVLPSGLRSTVKGIMQDETSLEVAYAPQSVSILLEDDIDVSRGDCIVAQDAAAPRIEKSFTSMCCWMGDEPLVLGKKYILRTAVSESVCMVKSIVNRLDMSAYFRHAGAEQASGREQLVTKSGTTEEISLKMNDIASIVVRTVNPLVVDSYADNHVMGSFIIIDPDSFETVGAGMIE